MHVAEPNPHLSSLPFIQKSFASISKCKIMKESRQGETAGPTSPFVSELVVFSNNYKLVDLLFTVLLLSSSTEGKHALTIAVVARLRFGVVTIIIAETVVATVSAC